MNRFVDEPPASPCISVCKMDRTLGTAAEIAAGGLCTGCLRTLDEIIEWGKSTDRRKREILIAVASRHSV